MEIKIIKSELLKGLGAVQSIVERKTTMPILTNVLLEAKGRFLSITATDLEVGLNCAHPAEVLSEGRVAVHARSIYDIVRELPEELVHVEVGTNNWVVVECGRSNFKIVGLSPEEFPALPQRGKGGLKRLESTVLMEMVDRTSFAMSCDETRYNLNGVYLDRASGDASKLRMVATDGHRLSIVDRDIGTTWEGVKGIIIPRKGVLEIRKLLETSNEPFDIWMDTKHLVLYRGGITLVDRLIDGQFPPYEQVVPKVSKRVVTTNRAELIQAFKRVSVLSTDRTRGVKFSVSPKNIDIYASNPDLGEAHEGLPATYKGESFDVGFNARYFIEALSAIEDEQAVLEMGDETAPCIIRSELDRGFTHVIMPMRL